MTSSPAGAAVANASLAGPWYRTVTREQWRVLLAAKLGWMLDAMDFMLYTMAVGQLRNYFQFGDDTAGMLGTVTLVMSGIGGLTFGGVVLLLLVIQIFRGGGRRSRGTPRAVMAQGQGPPGAPPGAYGPPR